MSDSNTARYFAGCLAVALEEMLAFRETRALRQKELLSQYGGALACLSLNIPGEYKAFPLALRSFHEEIRSFTFALRADRIVILHEETTEEAAGYTAYISAAAPAETIKAIGCRIEEQHTLGRLFDIDVFSPSGGKLSRSDTGAAPRPCLVCGGDGFICARSRAHGLPELVTAVIRIMETHSREILKGTVSAAALKALMDEVAVTPKPGLVDRANNGAHRDMDIFTFIDSVSAILPYFRECALAGFESAWREETPRSLFESLRSRGKIAEILMQDASGGANTHRGAIFSLGILSAAFGRLYRYDEHPGTEQLLELCGAMTEGLVEDFARSASTGPDIGPAPGLTSGIASVPASHGETIFAQLGLRGIRGEVSQGFPTVRIYGLPQLQRALSEGLSINDAGITAFLCLLAHTEDTNIVHRSDLPTLHRIQEEAARFLDTKPGPEALREKAAKLDAEFITRNISPGGCADLLAVSFFLHWLQSA
ncbi:2-(5''-triphosphoribosyl)-3'-dephosphocoenzyme-A synthase (2-(5''-triphosphoribosyl)-3'-dephospho-CoA synthase) [Treponema primitia ZAS-2]|uniref:Probable 2-(5''-triphosphoribosyl)-3'-dephosphocoenzyme-A synthase n=1 Tax=Treponema primitia (strain ATCC BAA-887 / DSM 12427 / ZAS-2) TaxID=545694 RepID=F5YRC7_TREPZ|nr:citrate lyase holo-[acyl-carrier protein] synthase [Treponema primitia]AEF86648.1 2-(5''-triphosphoribosyl)-3'-dephosphocoenzyme-A synthase (2-(5''-triphosphoribosyl)-3'-dephospho-CoA synthase) [Treponema primitia ZAS-2]